MLTIHPWAWLFIIFSPLVVLIQDLVYGTALKVFSMYRTDRTWRKEEKGLLQHNIPSLRYRLGLWVSRSRNQSGDSQELLETYWRTPEIYQKSSRCDFELKWKWDSSSVLMKTDSSSGLPDKDTGARLTPRRQGKCRGKHAATFHQAEQGSRVGQYGCWGSRLSRWLVVIPIMHDDLAYQEHPKEHSLCHNPSINRDMWSEYHQHYPGWAPWRLHDVAC